jgi:hypothetical protein
VPWLDEHRKVRGERLGGPFTHHYHLRQLALDAQLLSKALEGNVGVRECGRHRGSNVAHKIQEGSRVC